VRLYRVTRNNPPTENDMKSAWDLGRRPTRESGEALFRRVSTFSTAAAAASKAQLLGLGDFIAELEVPDTVAMTDPVPSGHLGLSGTTPTQLLGYVQNVRPVNEVLH
jgi:hypothetical protein